MSLVWLSGFVIGTSFGGLVTFWLGPSFFASNRVSSADSTASPPSWR